MHGMTEKYNLAYSSREEGGKQAGSKGILLCIHIEESRNQNQSSLLYRQQQARRTLPFLHNSCMQESVAQGRQKALYKNNKIKHIQSLGLRYRRHVKACLLS